jgi:hypothetical protein
MPRAEKPGKKPKVAKAKPAKVAKKPRTKAESTGTIEKAKVGRPHGYTDKLGQRICDLVAQRTPVFEIIEMEGMPSKDTLYRWKREIPTFSDLYARAREYRADARQDYIDEVLRDARTGQIDPQVARLIVDTEKWQMGKEKPKAYGDKVALTNNDGGNLTIQVVTGVPRGDQ